MRQILTSSEIITTPSGAASQFFQRIFNNIVGMFNGEINVIETSSSITDTKFGIYYIVDTASGALTVSLPEAANQKKTKWMFFKNTGVNNLTINAGGAETIDGATSVVLSTNTFVTVVNNRTSWFIVGA